MLWRKDAERKKTLPYLNSDKMFTANLYGSARVNPSVGFLAQTRLGAITTPSSVVFCLQTRISLSVNWQWGSKHELHCTDDVLEWVYSMGPAVRAFYNFKCILHLLSEYLQRIRWTIWIVEQFVSSPLSITLVFYHHHQNSIPISPLSLSNRLRDVMDRVSVRRAESRWFDPLAASYQ